MPVNKRIDMTLDIFTTLLMRLILFALNISNLLRRTFRLSSFLGLILLLAFTTGCAPPASQTGEGKQSSSDSSASSDLPELSEQVIRERINEAFVREVPEENGAAEPISWRFNESEPKEIAVLDKKIDGTRATVLLDIKTRSAPGWRNPRALAGQIRTEWELKSGWALRQWEIIRAENVSMKYKNLPKPSGENLNR